VRLLLGRYRLIEQVGDVGATVVWRAHDEVLGRPVMIKMLGPRYAVDALSRARLLAEARSMAALAHPNIANVYDYGESDEGSGEPRPFLVMEPLDGQTLVDRLRAGPLRVPAALGVCIDVASALAAVHARGLVHGDIGPASVVLTPHGSKVVSIGNPGIARQHTAWDVDADLDSQLAFLAPERLARGELSPASDVYAAGLLLYYMLAGRLPWRVETAVRMLALRRYVRPAPLPRISGMPRKARVLCRGCLMEDPSERPNAQELVRVLTVANRFRVPAEVDIRHGHTGDAVSDSATLVVRRSLALRDAGDASQLADRDAVVRATAQVCWNG
jgi:serine/threonine protein kinase